MEFVAAKKLLKLKFTIYNINNIDVDTTYKKFM